ncbi:MAG: sulfurtransferase TusA [Pseudomonadales bacterium]
MTINDTTSTSEGSDRASPRAFDQALDARGLTCPEPLMLVRNAVRGLEPGQVLYVRATDPSTQRDLQNFCRFVGHELLDQNVDENNLEFWIRRA